MQMNFSGVVRSECLHSAKSMTDIIVRDLFVNANKIV